MNYKSLLSNRLQEYRNNPNKNPELNPLVIERNLLNRFSQSLGHRVRSVSTGGAKTSPKIIKFMQKCFNCIFSEGFGITEVGSVASNGIRKHEAQIKLQDVVEMGYTAMDKPNPRGLLWYKFLLFFINLIYKFQKKKKKKGENSRNVTRLF